MASIITPALIAEINRAVSSNHGIVKWGELSSAANRPAALAYYVPKSTPAQRAASLAFGIIQNHPFLDGNKRTAFWAANEYLKEATGRGLTNVAPSAANTDMAMAAIGRAHRDIARNTMTEEDLAQVYARLLK